MSRKAQIKKHIPLTVTIFLFAFLYYLSKNLPEQTVRQIILDAGLFAPVVFIFLALLTYIIAPLTGTPLLFVGYYIFGQTVIWYMSIAALISSVTNFLIARYFGRAIVQKFVGERGMHKIDDLTKNYGLVMLFFLRVFLKGLHDIISYAAGLTSISFRSYILVSTAGMIPGILLWYTLASFVNNPTAFTLITFAQISIFSTLFIIASIFIKKFRK